MHGRGVMTNEKTYAHEIIFAIVGVVIAFLFNNPSIFLQFFQFELSFGPAINLLIYYGISIFLIPMACLFGYLFLAPFATPFVKFEKIPKDRFLTFRNFSLLSSIIVTVLILEESYSIVKSPLVLGLVFILPLLYKFYFKFYNFYYYHFAH